MVRYCGQSTRVIKLIIYNYMFYTLHIVNKGNQTIQTRDRLTVFCLFVCAPSSRFLFELENRRVPVDVQGPKLQGNVQCAENTRILATILKDTVTNACVTILLATRTTRVGFNYGIEGHVDIVQCNISWLHFFFGGGVVEYSRLHSEVDLARNKGCL